MDDFVYIYNTADEAAEGDPRTGTVPYRVTIEPVNQGDKQ
jgi:hypothetical protein